MPIDPRQSPIIDSILSQLLGPVNRAVEPMMEHGPSAIDIINRQTNRPVAGKPGAPTMGQSFAGAVLNALSAIRPSSGLPTSRFSVPTMPPGYRNHMDRERGTSGALPETSGFRFPVAEDGTPTLTFRQQSNTFWPTHDLNSEPWRNIMQNMPDFPQSVPRNLRDAPQTPYPGTTQGMARRRDTRQINWDEEIPRITQILSRPQHGMEDLRAISRRLRVNQGTIYEEMERRGINPQQFGVSPVRSWRLTPQQRTELHTEIERGQVSRAELARRYGVSPAAITLMAKRGRPQLRTISDNIDNVIAMRETGLTYKQIGDQLGISEVAVRQALERRNMSTIGPQSRLEHTVDAGVASLMRDAEQRMRNRGLSDAKVAEGLRREFGLNENQLPTSVVQQGRGFYRRMR